LLIIIFISWTYFNIDLRDWALELSIASKYIYFLGFSIYRGGREPLLSLRCHAGRV